MQAISQEAKSRASSDARSFFVCWLMHKKTKNACIRRRSKVALEDLKVNLQQLASRPNQNKTTEKTGAIFSLMDVNKQKRLEFAAWIQSQTTTLRRCDLLPYITPMTSQSHPAAAEGAQLSTMRRGRAQPCLLTACQIRETGPLKPKS